MNDGLEMAALTEQQQQGCMCSMCENQTSSWCKDSLEKENET